MIKRTIEISNPSYLKLKDKQLLIEQEGEMIGKCAIEDLAVLILNHYAITLTLPLIIECQKNNIVIIFCNEKHLPYSSILPISEGHSLHHKVIAEQIAAKNTTLARIWQSVVQTKIKEQAKTLNKCNKQYQRLIRLSKEVKPKDKTNCEAVAARYYWRELFGNQFIRDFQAEGVNCLLNYGYSIVRAALARSICAAGLHPALGIYHSNQYNSLSLSDDLMEPFRPWVDLVVYDLSKKNKIHLDSQTKLELLKILSFSVYYQKRKMPLMVSLSYLLADYKRALIGKIKAIKYPTLV